MKHAPATKILTIEGNVELGYNLTWAEYGQVVCFRHQMVVPTLVEHTAQQEGYEVKSVNTVYTPGE
jgi:hypothetical protein